MIIGCNEDDFDVVYACNIHDFLLNRTSVCINIKFYWFFAMFLYSTSLRQNPSFKNCKNLIFAGITLKSFVENYFSLNLDSLQLIVYSYMSSSKPKKNIFITIFYYNIKFSKYLLFFNR